MINFEDYKNWHYFIKGKIYFSNRAITRKLYRASVIFAEKDGLFYCLKNRYSDKYESIAFITRKGFIDYVQELYDSAAQTQIGELCGLPVCVANYESTYNVNEDSPIHLIKGRYHA